MSFGKTGSHLLELRLIGPLEVVRDGVRLALPASRKARALLAYLALERRAHRRTRLCELLWDVPDDPRAALRWSLTKLRPLVDAPDRPRLIANRETVAFDAAEMRVDVEDLRRAARTGLQSLAPAELDALLASLRGSFLEDSDLPHQPEFQAWVAAVRADMQAIERQLLDELIARAEANGAVRLGWLDRLLTIDPYDESAHAARIAALIGEGQRGEAERAARLARRTLSEAGVAATGAIEAALAREARPSRPAPALPRGVIAGIAVLPFTTAGDGPEGLADLIASGVVDCLSRFRSLLVVARGSTEQYRGRVVEPAMVGRALGVGYLLGGTVLAGEAQVRVRYRLVEAESGALVWSDEASGATGDLLALEAAIAGQISAVIEPRIKMHQMVIARRRATAAGAKDLFLRALPYTFGAETDFIQATALLEQAIAIDPDYAMAGAYLPWTAYHAGATIEPAARARYERIARKAARDGADDAIVLALAGVMVVTLGGDHASGADMVARAGRINPNSVFAWTGSGWLGMYRGEDARPMADFDRAERLSPADPSDYNVNAGRAYCAFQAGRLDEADEWVLRALARARSPEALRIAVATAAERGDLGAARGYADELMALKPAETARSLGLDRPFRRRETAERLHGAARAAGLPDRDLQPVEARVG